MNIKNVFSRVLWIILGGIMLVQIVSGICWMAANFTNIPVFGDSTEYFNLSQTLQVDEYRPILYPLLIRIAVKLCAWLPFQYQTLLYIGQTGLSLLCIVYLTWQLCSIFAPALKKERRSLFIAGVIFVSLYILCIPMITFMNLTVLTDSIATSMLLSAIGALVRIFHSKTPFGGDFLVVLFSMVIEYTVRADRLYTCTLFLFITLTVYVVKNRRNAFFRRAAALSLSVVLFSAGIAGGINKATQQPGLYGRIPTTLGFVLLDRIVWPNMVENYRDFPDEIQKLITREEAKTFDSHNNNVMYQMAPLLRERAGEERAEEIYKEMAGIVFRNHPAKVIMDIAEDILCVVFTPVSAFLSMYGLADTADDWNLHCVSQNSVRLSNFYYQFYLYTFIILFILSVLLFLSAVILKKKRGRGRPGAVFRLLAPGFLLCVIIALWFSVGDGAPPNDRYALLHYVIWTFWVLGTMYDRLRPARS